MPLAGPQVESRAFERAPDGRLMWQAVVANLLPTDPVLRARIEVHVIVNEALRARFDAEPLVGVNMHSTRASNGPLATVLTLRDLLNDASPVLIANGDQFLAFDRGVDLFYRAAFHPSYEGAVSTFYNPFPQDLRWSYMTVSSAGLLMSIQEKKYVGPYATTGVYAWRSGKKFICYADAVIRDNVSVNGNYYVAQVYSQAVAEGLRFRNIPCESVHKLADIESRDKFLTSSTKKH
jgi:hypothetical protein